MRVHIGSDGSAEVVASEEVLEVTPLYERTTVTIEDLDPHCDVPIFVDNFEGEITLD